MNKQQYQEEQNELLTAVLRQRFFLPWQHFEAVEGQYALRNDSSLEIYLTAACNQKCEYCYLQKYEELYPRDKMQPEHLLHNLSILYDWMIENNYHVKTLDFFSGDVWQTQFGLDVLQLTYDYMLKGLNFDDILIASNCSFVSDPVQLQKIQNYINLFTESNHPFVFSISIDGKVIDTFDRPRNNKDSMYTDQFYELLFSFAKHNGYGFHPMVSAQNVHLWHDNLKWWKEMTKKYRLRFDTRVMMLEVRNSDWTEESIKDYCAFVVELIEDFLNTQCNGDTKLLARLLGNIRIPLDNTDLPLLGGYYPWALSDVDTFYGCTITSQLAVRIGDLAICPCHRQAYDKYLYGHFKVENDKICGIEARNPQMAIKILMGNIKTAFPQCDICKYRTVCLRGCLGSQLETMRDPFIPIPAVCKFFYAKYDTVLTWYRDHGIIDYWRSIDPQEYRSDELVTMLNFIDEWESDKYGVGKCE